jgi:hypothetical protein
MAGGVEPPLRKTGSTCYSGTVTLGRWTVIHEDLLDQDLNPAICYS